MEHDKSIFASGFGQPFHSFLSEYSIPSPQTFFRLFPADHIKVQPGLPEYFFGSHSFFVVLLHRSDFEVFFIRNGFLAAFGDILICEQFFDLIPGEFLLLIASFVD